MYRQRIVFSATLAICVAALFFFSAKSPFSAEKERALSAPIYNPDSIVRLFDNHPDFLCNGFDFPVGKPDGKGYMNAQPFTRNNHLGDDWNGVKGGNSDKGDPVFSIGDGVVIDANDYKGGWGKVIRIVHGWKDTTGQLQSIESLYAHLHKMKVAKGAWVKKGTEIGSIGDADGKYLAHLHLEIREKLDMPLGGGYSADTLGFVNPTTFIKSHRKLEQ